MDARTFLCKALRAIWPQNESRDFYQAENISDGVVELPEKLDFELIPLVRAQSTVFEPIEDLFTSELMG